MPEAVTALSQAARNKPLNSLLSRLCDQVGEHGEAPLSRRLKADTPSNRERVEALRWQMGPVSLDASKQKLDVPTLELLLEWAELCGLDRQRSALFAGEPVNVSEGRAALHTALRWPLDELAPAGSEQAVKVAKGQKAKMATLVERIRCGGWQGATGKSIRHLVHISVGGSDLGPRLVSQALAEECQQGAVDVHFVSCMDGGQLLPLMRSLDPATTLIVAASKSFNTVDTLFNLRTVLSWISDALGLDEQAVRQHQLLGVSARTDKMAEFGIPTEHQLEFEEWVGGRFSLWSTIGVSLAVQNGMPAFQALLDGAHAMDCHFLKAPAQDNLPVLAAVIGAWNSQFMEIPIHAVLPYDNRLALLPAYLQQIEMESNGKSSSRGGSPVESRTCPILWGDLGPNAQHAFYQLLHQGSHTVSADLLAVTGRYQEEEGGLADRLHVQQRLTLANCLAQSQLLALGDEAIPPSLQGHLAQGYRGNQPHSLLLMERLTPYSLGMLLALYEHKVFVQSLLWDLNSFDQPGVELGKRLAESVHRRLGGDQVESAEVVDDLSTQELLDELAPGAPQPTSYSKTSRNF